MNSSIKKLINFTTSHKPLLAKIFLFTLLISATAPVSTWLFSRFLDMLIAPNPELLSLIALVALSFLVSTSGTVLANFSGIWTDKLVLNIYWDMFVQSYDHIVHSKLSKEQEKDYQTAFASARDWLDSVVFIFVRFIIGFFLEFSVASFIILINFGWKYLALLMVFTLLPLALFAPFARKVRDINLAAHQSNLEVNRNLAGIITNLRLIRIFQTRRYEKQQATQTFETYSSNQIREERSYFNFNIIRAIVISLISFALITLIIIDVQSGEIQVGKVYLFYSYMGLFLINIYNLPFHYLRLQQNITRLSPLLDADRLEVISTDQDVEYFPEIERMVVKNFRCPYLPDLDPKAVYEFERGEIYWLRGENGAGKSTFLKALFGISHEATSDVQILPSNGSKQVNLDVNSRARNFALSTQEAQIWQRPVKDNLEYAKHCDFGTAQPKDFVDQLQNEPAFERIDFEKTASDLSGGQEQLVHIYRALGKASPVLLLDEPTNSLDGEVILRLIKALRTHAPETIIIMATHSEYLQNIATREMQINLKQRDYAAANNQA